jgi:hypothetical protein
MYVAKPRFETAFCALRAHYGVQNFLVLVVEGFEGSPSHEKKVDHFPAYLGFVHFCKGRSFWRCWWTDAFASPLGWSGDPRELVVGSGGSLSSVAWVWELFNGDVPVVGVVGWGKFRCPHFLTPPKSGLDNLSSA